MDRHSPSPSPGAIGMAGLGLLTGLQGQIATAVAPLVALLLLGTSAADFTYLRAVRALLAPLISVLTGMLTGRQPTVTRKALRVAAMLSIPLIGLSFLMVSERMGASVLGLVSIVATAAYSVSAPALFPPLTLRIPSEPSNCWLERLRSFAILFGPALGSVIAGLTGASAERVVVIGLLLLAVLLLPDVADSARTALARRATVMKLRDGVSFVAGHRLLRSVLLTAVFFNLAWFIVQDVYVAYAVHHLGLTEAEVATTSGIYVAGMLAGGLAAPWLVARMRFEAIMAIGPALGLAAAAMVTATIVYPSMVLAGLGFFLFGAAPVIWTTATLPFRRSVTADPANGRVSTVITTAIYGARLLGTMLGAGLAARFGADICLVVAAFGFLVQFVVIVGGLARAPRASSDNRFAVYRRGSLTPCGGNRRPKLTP